MAQLVGGDVLTVRIRDVPEHLRKSSFFMNLINEDDNETIEVPSNCYYPGLNIECNDDLLRLLSTMRFWGIDEVPNTVINYCLEAYSPELAERCQEFHQSLLFLKPMLEVSAKPATERVRAALRIGSFELVRYFHQQGQDFDQNPLRAAVLSGNVEVVRYLIENGFPLKKGAVMWASIGGQLKCLRYFSQLCGSNKSIFRTAPKCCFYAAQCKGDRVDCLQFLHENGCSWEADVCNIAAERGHLMCLRYAHENGCPWEADAIVDVAAEANQFACFRYLVEKRCRMGQKTCPLIVKSGNVEMLQYAHQRGCRLHGFDKAALNGHWSILQYAVEHGERFTKDEFLAALQGKQEQIAVFVLSVGAKATPGGWLRALDNRMKSVLDKICEMRALWPGRECQQDYIDAQLALSSQTGRKLSLGNAGGCLHCAHRLHGLGYHWSDAQDYYKLFHYSPANFASYLAYNGFLDCLQFALAHGCSWDKRTCTAAALGGRIEVLQWAHKQGCSWDAEETAQAAAVGGNAECIAYVQRMDARAKVA